MHTLAVSLVALTLTLLAVAPVSAEPSMLLVNPTGEVLTGDPAKYGEWSAPFEEGGAETPRCRRVDNSTLENEIVCKPAAVSMAALPDGRIWYSNGLEADENVRFSYFTELGNRTRADLLRLMDLSGPTPQWSKPDQETGGAPNPQTKAGANWTNGDPFGVVGAPGRPGDGPVSSTWGKLGGPPQEPSAPPDDKAYQDRATFCADVAQLDDGRLLVVGGSDYYNEPSLADRKEGAPTDVGVVELEGLRSSRIFDWRTNSYTNTEPMNYGRWYPGTVTMPDGKVSVMSGVTKLIKATQAGQVRRTELFDPATGKWTVQYVDDASETPLPLFPRLTLMPNGKVLYNGSGQVFGPGGEDAQEAEFALQKFWNPQTKQWELIGPALGGSRGSASQVLLPLKAPYDQGGVLLFGGALAPTPSASLATTLSTLTTVTKDGRVENRLTKGQLNNRRWFSDGTILPDGTILATNGGDKDALITPGLEVPVHQAELYDPATDVWTPLSSSTRDRAYHNTATLLADGRVLIGGNSPLAAMFGARRDQGAGVMNNNEKDPSFEIFSPPYLFRGPRPEISYAPSGIAWGSKFPVRLAGADEIASVALIRMPSPQHAIDSDSRSVELEFDQDGQNLTASAPPDGVVAPPGMYYLFVNKKTDKGLVPSVAAVVRVGDIVTAAGLGDASPAVIPLRDTTVAAKAGSATPDEDSSMNDFGECTGCAEKDRGGMRHDLQQSAPPAATLRRQRPLLIG
ncbi:MAG TPA: galactose oxidase early set domain-containing protein [Acidimicrobiia bacterium]|nr:galactose oxidase early set domain-containing protein [Acidimicrobiia bacterium]